MAITSPVEICNLTLSLLGNLGTVENIQEPETPKEITFAAWYDITRQHLIKMLMPNFALQRTIVAQVVETPAFGYTKAYSYPAKCLKVLGIGNIEDKENNLVVETNENDELRIYANDDYPDGMPIRMIADVENVNSMTPEFKILFARAMAINTCLELTQDLNKLQLLQEAFPVEFSAASGVNAQENKPIRKSTSRFRQGRYTGVGNFQTPDKK